MRKIISINAIIITLVAVVFCLYPSTRAFLDLGDPALRGPGIPKLAQRLFRSLTPEYAEWARKRISLGSAENLDYRNISGTEWPLFGSVFFLWGVENLQAAWNAGDHSGGVEPKVYAREAIVAASELVIDPGHAVWVKKHWGTNYLHSQNVFHRMLIIAALTSREKLIGDLTHHELLREQVESMARELELSGSGLLDDYPGQCYPGDVMTTILCIRRADAVLGTDHAQFVTQALRGFIGKNATRYEIPPYSADSTTGLPHGHTRGCANSYVCLAAPELWPEQARHWFSQYEKHFWQHRIGAQGFREFPHEITRFDWSADVDAGPIIAGHGVAASAFGAGAARKNGRFDLAYPLTAQMAAVSLELPNGALAVPRLLSNLSDAPLLGEAAFLWLLTIQPEAGFPVKTGGNIPVLAWVVPAALMVTGALLVLLAATRFQKSRKVPEPTFTGAKLQIVIWLTFLLAALICWLVGHGLLAVLLMLCALLFPIWRTKIPKPAEPGAEPFPVVPLDRVSD